ncbi:hypothetical protein OSB04_007526 [Centaurea solstitialis]|uniref:Uncharacterized protein n=1 Tax=Centaurea solstitialis TaxID=347529 RepID=A0AA38TXU0_9ASTR|nr:hypothetical protein OSB04_007526 [Centaurea solstitialis]
MDIGDERPNMVDVLWDLKYALKLHQVIIMIPKFKQEVGRMEGRIGVDLVEDRQNYVPFTALHLWTSFSTPNMNIMFTVTFYRFFTYVLDPFGSDRLRLSCKLQPFCQNDGTDHHEVGDCFVKAEMTGIVS